MESSPNVGMLIRIDDLSARDGVGALRMRTLDQAGHRLRRNPATR
jgi:hypothetical protein